MKKQVWLAVCLALLLCGCGAGKGQKSPAPEPSPAVEATATPAPTPTPSPDWEPEVQYNPDSAFHDTYEIDLGDGTHSFRLEAVAEGVWPNEFEQELTLSFYEGQEPEPVQVIETVTMAWPESFELLVEDINFDGCMDFYYLWSEGTHNRYYVYYVWDKEKRQFIEDPYGLGELENPSFDQADRVVISWKRSSIWGGSFSFYRYEEDGLNCIRVCSYPYTHDPESAALRVKERINGLWQTVFEVERTSDAEFTEEEQQEYSRWNDINYRHYQTIPFAWDVGDGSRKLWVEITRREAEGEGIPITVSVYDSQEKAALLQSWEDTVNLYQFEDIRIASQDLDFDGYMDLEYSSWLSARMAGRAYWIWDEKTEKFVRDPYGLEDLPWPEFDWEKGIVTTWYNEAGGTEDAYYRYYDGKLTCIRRLTRDVEMNGERTTTAVVEDYVDGRLKEVYRSEKMEDNGVTWPSTEAFKKWYDLDYHGEERP